MFVIFKGAKDDDTQSMISVDISERTEYDDVISLPEVLSKKLIKTYLYIFL